MFCCWVEGEEVAEEDDSVIDPIDPDYEDDTDTDDDDSDY